MKFTQIKDYKAEAYEILNNKSGIIKNVIDNNTIIYSLAIKRNIRGKEALAYIMPKKLEFWNNGNYDMFDVAFKIQNASEEMYSKIKMIEVRLYKNNKIIAKRVANERSIKKLKEHDIFFGGLNGELNCSFKARKISERTSFWKSSPYDLTTPDKVEILLSVFNKNKINTYIVESNYVA